MTKDEAKEIFSKLASFYPNWKVDRNIAENWIGELIPEDAENARANVKEYIRKERFAPTLSDIIKPNAQLSARREVEQTKKFIREQDKLRESIPDKPPWVREGISREAWMKRVVTKGKAL
ncbi:hypothetical protein PMSD_23000 [Paenibacillus macquariensis subsp. defensor]|nr:hypothetical protein PMSD_23000 [Paenibacillus macquariensis subsp. defensor]